MPITVIQGQPTTNHTLRGKGGLTVLPKGPALWLTSLPNPVGTLYLGILCVCVCV